jgi:glycosyltransferase involved in cell wall biosynthesis
MPRRQVKITVLIPTFNRAAYLAECLDSVLCQTVRPWQTLVVNDGSTDETREVLQPYRAAIDYIETDQVGKPGALNAGLRQVTGDYLWIFDDDDVAIPDALERLVAPLEAHPEHAFSYSTFFYTATQPDSHRLGGVLRESRIPPLEERGSLIPLLEANFLGGAALFARTSCYDAVGDFDTRLLRSQDYEMAVRIARRFTGIRVPGPPAFHYRQHEGLRGSLADRFQVAQRLRKWLHYDQIIFRDLYDSLPLADYLPPQSPLEQGHRQAHLQRLAIMASKLLMPEVLSELRRLTQLSDDSPLSLQERRILRTAVNRVPYYQDGCLDDHVAFFDEIRRLARHSPVLRRIQAELMRSLPARWKMRRHWRHPRQIARTISHGLRLYMPGFDNLSLKRIRSRRPIVTVDKPFVGGDGVRAH